MKRCRRDRAPPRHHDFVFSTQRVLAVHGETVQIGAVAALNFEERQVGRLRAHMGMVMGNEPVIEQGTEGRIAAHHDEKSAATAALFILN